MLPSLGSVWTQGGKVSGDMFSDIPHLRDFFPAGTFGIVGITLKMSYSPPPGELALNGTYVRTVGTYEVTTG